MFFTLELFSRSKTLPPFKIILIDSRTLSTLGFKRKPSAFKDGDFWATSSPERIIRIFDSDHLSLNFNNSNLIRSSDWKLRIFHIIKSGVFPSIALFNVISKFLSSDVNLSDRDSAIKLGAIISMDFFDLLTLPIKNIEYRHYFIEKVNFW